MCSSPPADGAPDRPVALLRVHLRERPLHLHGRGRGGALRPLPRLQHPRVQRGRAGHTRTKLHVRFGKRRGVYFAPSPPLPTSSSPSFSLNVDENGQLIEDDDEFFHHHVHQARKGSLLHDAHFPISHFFKSFHFNRTMLTFPNAVSPSGLLPERGAERGPGDEPVRVQRGPAHQQTGALPSTSGAGSTPGYKN